MRGLVDFGQCGGDNHRDGVTPVQTHPAGGDRGFHRQLERVMAALGGCARITRIGLFLRAIGLVAPGPHGGFNGLEVRAGFWVEESLQPRHSVRFLWAQP